VAPNQSKSHLTYGYSRLYAALVLFYLRCLCDPEPIEKTFGNFPHPLLLIGFVLCNPALLLVRFEYKLEHGAANSSVLSQLSTFRYFAQRWFDLKTFTVNLDLKEMVS
jgi:hypothetical protein